MELQSPRVFYLRKMIILIIILLFANVARGALENETCTTLEGGNGLCQSSMMCSKYWEILRNPPISADNQQMILNSQCGTADDGKPLLCCANSTTSDSCTTPNEKDGICRPFNTCPVLFKIYQKKPVSAINMKFLRDSVCRTGSNGKPWLCCPPSQPSLNNKPNDPEDKPCKDAKGDDGMCVQVLNCRRIEDMLAIRPISPQNRQYLRNSQCAFENRIPFVCCADEVDSIEVSEEEVEDDSTNENQVPSWLTALRLKLPQPPSCGLDTNDKIMGGEEAQIDEFPWIVLLEYEKPNNKTGYDCGGSLINDRYVLTAAHCIRKIPAVWKLKGVRIGEWNLATEQDCNEESYCAPPVVNIQIDEIITYKNYRKNDKNQHFDIALLRLADKVEFNYFVKPICLPLDPQIWSKNFTHHSFEVAGWGRTEKSARSKIKMKVGVPYHPNCKEIYKRQNLEVFDTQICAGGVAGKDSCGGDSGGPLMIYNVHDKIPYWVAIGIVSYGPSDCGTEGVPGVYTKVSSYLEWIAENVKD